MKKLLISGAGILLSAMLVVPAQADFPDEPPSGPIKMELTSRPVVYDHAIHIAQDCGVCHATMPQHFPRLTVSRVENCTVCHHLIDGELPPMMQCSGCHYETDIKDKSETSYFRIAHARDVAEGTMSCLNCHLDVIKTRPDKRQQLTGCAGSACHPQ